MTRDRLEEIKRRPFAFAGLSEAEAGELVALLEDAAALIKSHPRCWLVVMPGAPLSDDCPACVWAARFEGKATS